MCFLASIMKFIPPKRTHWESWFLYYPMTIEIHENKLHLSWHIIVDHELLKWDFLSIASHFFALKTLSYNRFSSHAVFSERSLQLKPPWFLHYLWSTFFSFSVIVTPTSLQHMHSKEELSCRCYSANDPTHIFSGK